MLVTTEAGTLSYFFIDKDLHWFKPGEMHNVQLMKQRSKFGTEALAGSAEERASSEDSGAGTPAGSPEKGKHRSGSR